MTTPQNPQNPQDPRNPHGQHNPHGPNSMRIGDPERSRAIDYLSDRFANGYLTSAEFDERTAQAAKATQQSELDALLADLPAPSPQASGNAGGGAAVASNSGAWHDDNAERELAQIKDRGKKLEKISAGIWAAAIIFMLISITTDIVDKWWVVFPLAAIVNWAIYRFMGQSSDDVEIYDQIKEEERHDRRERIERARERRQELGY